MKRHDKLADTLPVGTLGILALESSHDMGKRVNDYIVDWRSRCTKCYRIYLCRIQPGFFLD